MNSGKVTIVLFVGVLVMLGLGCGTVQQQPSAQEDGGILSSLFNSATATPTPWPHSNPGLVQAVNTQPVAGSEGDARPVLYLLDTISERFPAQFVPPPELSGAVIVPPPKEPISNQPRPRIEIPQGQPVQLNSTHVSFDLLSAIDITVNGQPIGPDTTAYLDVQVCRPSWQRLANRNFVRLCMPDNLSRVAQIDLQPEHIKRKHLTLIVTGYRPGSYQLKITATDNQKRTSTISNIIEIVDDNS